MTARARRNVSDRATFRGLVTACDNCGAAFVASRPGRRFCSSRCRSSSTRAGRLRQWLLLRDQLDRLILGKP